MQLLICLPPFYYFIYSGMNDIILVSCLMYLCLVQTMGDSLPQFALTMSITRELSQSILTSSPSQPYLLNNTPSKKCLIKLENKYFLGQSQDIKRNKSQRFICKIHQRWIVLNFQPNMKKIKKLLLFVVPNWYRLLVE